ncbi:MAG TPA: error-prone DNA polymerase [Roseiarcus sp.]|jgi:error-prone DNA polymerase|nr:error-prone DNA polymerase [Roseiarcus sp.]
MIRLAPRFAELATTTNFSFLRGASHPEELVATAAALKLHGVGIADRNSLAGVVRAHVFARENKEAMGAMRVAPGARLVFSDGAPDILAYPKDRAAYGRLARLLTSGNLRAKKGECRLTINDLLDHAEGLSIAVMPRAEPPRETEEAEAFLLSRLSEAFPRRAWLAASLTYGAHMRGALAERAALSRASGLPLLATNDVLMHAPERRALADVVACIREGVRIEEAGRLLAANAERHLKDPAEMARLFREAPQALEETIRFFDGLSFSLDELSPSYPEELREGYRDPQAALEAFTWAGALKRYPSGVPEKVVKALGEELELIAQCGFAPYFLTVHDIIRFARSQEKEILAQGRGSAANSSVCYCLGVTEIDPARYELLFARFISPERKEPPDIDVDFEHERREEVIQYIYRRFGRDKTGLAASVITYRARSAIREVAKVFGLSDDIINALTSTTWGYGDGGVNERDARRGGLDPSDPTLAMAIGLAGELVGFPRHLSQHTGGFVITRDRLDEVVPILNAAMEDRTTIEWDKDDLDALRILKVDVLALGMLTALRKGFEMIDKHYGRRFTLATIPSEEACVYAMIQRADTIGVFQIESRAQMSMLPRLKPAEFYDLVIEVAIVRPGPIQGDMVHPYLRRRQGIDEVFYHSEELKEVLKRTLGVPLFQEQAMSIAIVAAGFTPAEADRLRRAMATFRRVGTIGNFERKMIDGMTAKGYPREFAERCFKQIEGFGDYGFPESHAASFALLVYVSAWMKCRYPDVFCAALINAQPMGFYAPAQIVRDAREHGVEVREVDVNLSDWDCTLESVDALSLAAERQKTETARSIHQRHASMAPDILATCAVRLGLRQVVGLSEADMRVLMDNRGAGYDSIRDLWLRTGLGAAVIEKLAEADAFRSLGLDRRAALWAARGLDRVGDQDSLPLFLTSRPQREHEPDARLPPMPLGAHVVEDYRRLSLSLKGHPVAFMRRRLDARAILRCEQLTGIASGARVVVSGLVLVRQRPGTASGVVFMTLEDESGIANIIVWPKVFEKLRAIVIGARFVAVTGKLQSESNVVHVVAERMEDLTPMLGLLSERGGEIDPAARADEARTSRPDPREKRPGARACRPPALAAPSAPAIGEQRDLLEAMPLGRRFH